MEFAFKRPDGLMTPPNVLWRTEERCVPRRKLVTAWAAADAPAQCGHRSAARPRAPVEAWRRGSDHFAASSTRRRTARTRRSDRSRPPVSATSISTRSSPRSSPASRNTISRAVFYRPLRSVEAVEYRQDVMRDLEDQGPLRRRSTSLRRAPGRFGTTSRRRRNCTTNIRKQAWSLDAIELYCKAVERLLRASRSPPRVSWSHGFRRLSRRVCRVAGVSAAHAGCGGAQGQAGVDPLHPVDTAAASSPSRPMTTSRTTVPKSRPTSKSSGRARPPTTFSSSRLRADEPYRGRRPRSRRATVS